MVKLAIDSILNQTYKDFEFIICDDGTYELVQNLIKKDDRVILIKNEKNRGLAYSLNHCLSIAKGNILLVWMQMIFLCLIDLKNK